MSDAGIPAPWLGKRLSDLKGNEKYLEQVNICRNWDFKKPVSLYLDSDCGTGKTHIAVCLFRKFIIQSVEAKMNEAKINADSYFSVYNLKYRCFYKEADLLSLIYQSYNNKYTDESEILENLSRQPILIIDDLFSSRTNDNARRIMFDLIDKRLDWKQLPTLITSNWSIEKIANEIDVRIASRLSSGLVINLNTETDYRINNNPFINSKTIN